MKHVYMATTNDIYELPCCVETAREVAAFVGLTIGSFYCAISRKTRNCNRYHIYKVEVEDEEQIQSLD